MITKSRSVPKSYILLSSVSVILFAVVLLYFLIWRPSDADYQVAIINTNSLTLNVKSFSQIFSTTGLPRIGNGDQLNNFVSDVDSYQQVVGFLLDSPVAQRGFAARTEIEKDKQVLLNYGTSIKNTRDAIAAYYEIDRSCGKLRTDASAVLTPSQLGDCQLAFDQAKSASDSGFKTQFLNAYVADVEKMLSISVDTKNDAHSKAAQIGPLQADLNNLLQNAHIDYKLAPAPTADLNNLLSVLNSEISTLFR